MKSLRTLGLVAMLAAGTAVYAQSGPAAGGSTAPDAKQPGTAATPGTPMPGGPMGGGMGAGMGPGMRQGMGPGAGGPMMGGEHRHGDGAMHQHHRHGERGMMFGRLDTDRDGSVSRQELQAAQQRQLAWFEQVDANKDGKLTRDEMRAFRDSMRSQHRHEHRGPGAPGGQGPSAPAPSTGAIPGVDAVQG